MTPREEAPVTVTPEDVALFSELSDGRKNASTKLEAIARHRTQSAAAAKAREEELQRVVDFNVGFNLDLLDDNAALRISKYEMHKLLKDALEIINDQVPGEFPEWEKSARAALSASDGEVGQ